MAEQGRRSTYLTGEFNDAVPEIACGVAEDCLKAKGAVWGGAGLVGLSVYAFPPVLAVAGAAAGLAIASYAMRMMRGSIREKFNASVLQLGPAARKELDTLSDVINDRDLSFDSRELSPIGHPVRTLGTVALSFATHPSLLPVWFSAMMLAAEVKEANLIESSAVRILLGLDSGCDPP